METPRIFQALINGVYLNIFGNDESLTPESLHEQLFGAESDTPVQAVAEYFELIGKILRQGAYENWDIAHLETALKKTKLTSTQQETFLKYWRIQKPKIQEHLRQKSNWSNSLIKLEWRIDLKSKSKSNPELNEPTSIVEMTIGKKTDEESKRNIVRFEMNKEQLDGIVSQLKAVEAQLQSLA